MNRDRIAGGVLFWLGAVILAFLGLAPGCAQAGCIVGPWVSTDKDMHAAGSAAMVFGANLAVRQIAPDAFKAAPWVGVLPGLAVGLMREYDKTRFGGRCEWASMTYDVAGIAAGLAASHWLLLPTARGASVAYVREF